MYLLNIIFNVKAQSKGTIIIYKPYNVDFKPEWSFA